MKTVIATAIALASCGGPTLTPTDRAELETHAAKLAACQEQGREAGTYAAYEACKLDAGLR